MANKSTRTTLTDQLVAGLEPSDQRYRVLDDQVTGFVCQVTPAGRKTFLMVIAVDGVHRNLFIGEHPGMTVTDARSRAQALRLEITGAKQVRRDAVTRAAIAPATPARLRLLQVYSDLKEYLQDTHNTKGMTPQEIHVAELLIRKPWVVAAMVAIYEADSLLSYEDVREPGVLLEFFHSRKSDLEILSIVADAHNRALCTRMGMSSDTNGVK